MGHIRAVFLKREMGGGMERHRGLRSPRIVHSVKNMELDQCCSSKSSQRCGPQAYFKNFKGKTLDIESKKIIWMTNK